MIEWINFFTLLFSTILFLQLYNMSVSPAFFERQWGEKAYRKCGAFRAWAMVFMFIACLNYVMFYFYPLPVTDFIPLRFPWDWWISILIAISIVVPSISLMIKGMIDAGSETAAPDKGHEMFGGIYRKIRHPQAAGEAFLFMAIAFGCHSPFLAIFSVIWFPIFYTASLAEEKDLVLRYGDDYVRYQNEVGMFFPRNPK